MKNRSEDILTLDIESTPNIVYCWHTGPKVNISPDNIIFERTIICVSYKWASSNKVYNIAWKNNDDRNILEHITPIINSAGLVIGQNSDRFDIRYLQGRAAYHGLDPIQPRATDDTMKMAKRAMYLNSYKLDYVGKFFMGQGKVKTDFELWPRVMKGDKAALKEMLFYCDNDVITTEKYYWRIKPYSDSKMHLGVLGGLARYSSCPNCASENLYNKETKVSKAGVRKQWLQCQNCRKCFPGEKV